MYLILIDGGVAYICSNQPIITNYRWFLCFKRDLIIDLSLSHNLQTIDVDYIHSLADIKALRKASMISVKQSENILFRTLVGFVHFNIIINKLQRVYHEIYAIEELPFACLFQNIGIKLLFIAFRNNIPGLSSPLVTIINRIQPQIFNMPTKRGELHTHIDPRNGHTANLFLSSLCHAEDGVVRLINIVQIE